MNIDWIKVTDALPVEDHCWVMVACDGGNVDKTFYCRDVAHHRNIYMNSSYNKKRLGQESGYFELAHEFGYKIMYWSYMPEAPEDCKQ